MGAGRPVGDQDGPFHGRAGFSDYGELWRWSVEDLEGFWAALWEWFSIDSAYERVLGRQEMPGAEWFPGAELSYAEHVFRQARPGATAILHATESRGVAEIGWDELREQVARCAAGLRRLGVERGDRVVAYMPNVPRRSSPFSPPPASARSGRAARPSSAPLRSWTASARSSPRS